MATLAALLVCADFLCPDISSARASEFVDGVSDQSLQRWDGADPGTPDSFASSTFARFFRGTWVGSAPAHVTLARYVIPWDLVGDSESVGYKEFVAWYHDVVDVLGLEPDVSLAAGQVTNVAGAQPSSSLQYGEYLGSVAGSLLDRFPAIRYIEPWNEPNNATEWGGVPDAARAAEYLNVARDLCHLHGCSVIAGNLLDSEPNLASYQRAYAHALSSDPRNWAIHPYHATKYHDLSTVELFRANLPDRANDRIWFTEVGAYYCQRGEISPRGEAAQTQDAEFLVNSLIPRFKPVHVFYYEFLFREHRETPCTASEGSIYSDTSLYTPSDRQRGAARIILQRAQTRVMPAEMPSLPLTWLFDPASARLIGGPDWVGSP